MTITGLVGCPDPTLDIHFASRAVQRDTAASDTILVSTPLQVAGVSVFIGCYKPAGLTKENIVFKIAACFGTYPVGQHVGAIGHDGKGL